MNKEIKEILDNLANKGNYIEEFGYQYKRISLYDSFQLLDYITNLQQENENLKQALHNITINGVEEENTTVLDLIKENKRLNNIINELEKYTIENIEVLENRLNSPFCNFEKATKELSIFQNYLDKLKELKGE